MVEVGWSTEEACGRCPSPSAERFRHLCRHVIEGRVNIGIGLMNENGGANERAVAAALLRAAVKKETARPSERWSVGYGPLLPLPLW